MSLSGFSRRLSVAPLAGVERQGRGSLGSGSLAVRISHSLPFGSHFIQGTHPLPLVQPYVHQGQGLGGRSFLFVGERSNQAGSSSFSGLLQLAFCGDEGLGFVEAGHRPFVTESEGSEDILQDGDSPVCSSFSSKRGLDGVSRLEGCVLADSDPSGKSQIPQIRGVREGVPVQDSLLWAIHGSADLHSGHGSSIRLRRYLDDWLIQASSWEQVLLALDTVLQLCQALGMSSIGRSLSWFLPSGWSIWVSF